MVSVEAAFGMEVDYSILQKIYGKLPGIDQETRYSPPHNFVYGIVTDARLRGGTGRRTGLKIWGILRFNNIRVLPKSTENIIQTHDSRGFLADLRSEAGVKLPKIHRRQIGDATPVVAS
ncbi:MAG TPA: hypothetical protein VFR18_03290 [Terriglobia bacterium]|nr:hypothetical protein [Terriglobia bacterium]